MSDIEDQELTYKRMDLERRVAERLRYAFVEETVGLMLDHGTPLDEAWLAVARETIAMLTRVAVEAHRGTYEAAAKTHRERHGDCIDCVIDVPAVDLTAALGEETKPCE